MPPTTVNGHVLLPHYPDWTRGVRRERLWQTAVDRALTGFEARVALRPKARERLSFRVESRGADDLSRLLSRVDAALKVGLGCCPGWGRGIPLLHAWGTEVHLSRGAWLDVQGGDFLFLAEPDDGQGFEVAQVEAVDEDTLTVTEDMVGEWDAAAWAWPLLFGRPGFSAIEFRTDWHAGLTVTLTQLEVRPLVIAPPPPPPPPPPPGATSPLLTFTYFDGAMPVLDNPQFSFEFERHATPLPT